MANVVMGKNLVKERIYIDQNGREITNPNTPGGGQPVERNKPSGDTTDVAAGTRGV